MPQAVAWCQATITPAHPNFRFQAPDVKNDRYNSEGLYLASTYVFPFESKSFDFVFLGSVFTHMFAPDMRNYLSEIARTLKPGATSVISWYLIDDTRRDNIARGPHGLAFRHKLDGCWCEFPKIPEAAIAFERAGIEALYADLGLTIEGITLGQWDRTTGQDQDLIVARKA